jgi:hypothetical protein
VHPSRARSPGCSASVPRPSRTWPAPGAPGDRLRGERPPPRLLRGDVPAPPSPRDCWRLG